MSGWCCGAGAWAMALGLILLTALIVGAITLIRALRWRGGGNRGQGSPGGSDAIRTLEERSARGDINQQEFEERRRRSSERLSDLRGEGDQLGRPL